MSITLCGIVSISVIRVKYWTITYIKLRQLTNLLLPFIFVLNIKTKTISILKHANTIKAVQENHLIIVN